MPDRVRTVPFKDAWAFFQVMTPANAKLEADYDQTGYLYRGHRSDQHDLLPSAFRTDRCLLHGGVWRSIATLTTNRDQLSAELDTLTAFVEVADRQGLPLPEDSQRLRRLLRDQRNTYSTPGDSMRQIKWPPADL